MRYKLLHLEIFVDFCEFPQSISKESQVRRSKPTWCQWCCYFGVQSLCIWESMDRQSSISVLDMFLFHWVKSVRNSIFCRKKYHVKVHDFVSRILTLIPIQDTMIPRPCREYQEVGVQNVHYAMLYYQYPGFSVHEAGDIHQGKFYFEACIDSVLLINLVAIASIAIEFCSEKYESESSQCPDANRSLYYNVETEDSFQFEIPLLTEILLSTETCARLHMTIL